LESHPVPGQAPHHVRQVVGSALHPRMLQELAATATRRSSPASADSASRQRVSLLTEWSASPCGLDGPLEPVCLDSLNPRRPLASVVTARSSFAACPAAPDTLSSLHAGVRRPARSAARGHVFPTAVSRPPPLGHPSPSRTCSFSPARRLASVSRPDARHRADPAVRLPRARAAPLSRGSCALSYDSVAHLPDARSRGTSGSGSSPSTVLALTRRQLESGARQARSPHLTVARTRRSRGSRLRALVRPLGSADGGDPGRHRPMSATHDFVFKTGTHSSRHTPLGVPAPRGGLALHGALGQPRRSRPRHEGLFVPSQRLRAYRGCFVARGFPGRTRLARPPALPRCPHACEHSGLPPMV
jgi:hypothetical protein